MSYKLPFRDLNARWSNRHALQTVIFEKLQAFLDPHNRPSLDVLIGLLNEANALSTQERIWLNTQLKDQHWLEQVTIGVPSDTDQQDVLPDIQVARLMLTSPIELRFSSATDIVQGIFIHYPDLRIVVGRPDTSVRWSVADHRVAEEVWMRQTSTWNDWLQLLVESGLAPVYDKDNLDIANALNLSGVEGLHPPPEYVLLWFLTHFGNFRLFKERGTGKIYRYVDALKSLRWNETAMYAMCHSLNELEPTMKVLFQQHVTSDEDRGSGYLGTVMSQLMDFGAVQEAFNRLLALGYSVDMLPNGFKAHLYIFALNAANYAGLNLISSAFNPFPANKSSEDNLRFLVMVRRDMWPYVLSNFSEDAARKLRNQAKAQLRINEE